MGAGQHLEHLSGPAVCPDCERVQMETLSNFCRRARPRCTSCGGYLELSEPAAAVLQGARHRRHALKRRRRRSALS